ncbi:hypothetical protein [Leucothrix pacifica]|uniref:Uncharacterized protein n=1 Tax=Leucothrix pacifica TaxID=1247513 RepID=A0A317C3R2_9GAMM|nr:hypothetical protein [Leucothrix pacifica]PWQ92811.1 hypothetical protein DKW60_18870 [Leucothrix pacifica]
MFFKYNYKKYLKDVEAIIYEKEGTVLLKNLSGMIQDTEESKHFLLAHVSLVGCLFFEYITDFPVEMTKIEPEVHMKKLSGLFLKHASSLGFVVDDKSQEDSYREYFETSVRNLVGTNITAEILCEQYIQDPLSKTVYAQ